MFTGLIRDRGRIAGIETGEEGTRLRVETALADELGDGDSVAVNGVCLTVTGHDADGFSADVMNQTLRVTALAGLTPGTAVNLEPALRAGERLGGHIVQGHVDGVAEVVAIERDGFAVRATVTLPPELRRYVVEHGSIALDGVSLTVAALTPTGVVVSLIPETAERTSLGALEPGAQLNVEVDLIARYAERLLRGFNEGGTDEDDRQPS
jgi:riboflavin synthase